MLKKKNSNNQFKPKAMQFFGLCACFIVLILIIATTQHHQIFEGHAESIPSPAYLAPCPTCDIAYVTPNPSNSVSPASSLNPATSYTPSQSISPSISTQVSKPCSYK